MLEGGIPLSQFDFSEVGALDVGLFGETFLRPAFTVPELPDAFAERDGGIVARLCHSRIVRRRISAGNTLIVTIDLS